MNTVKKIRAVLSIVLIWRNFFSFIVYFCSNRRLIQEDLRRIMQYIPFSAPNLLSLNYALLFIKPFRSVFKYRTVQQKPVLSALYWLTPSPLCTIEIDGGIGGGLVIFHKLGCVISPAVAGKNLTVSQGVTIGKGHVNKNGICAPIIGDNVQFHTNSVCFGGITIGNNVVIGAGTVLNRDVPDNCTVVGNPPRIVKKDGKTCDILLKDFLRDHHI